jgi:cell shape-determining protein MreC
MSYLRRNSSGAHERGAKRKQKRVVVTILFVVFFFISAEFIFPVFARGIFTAIISPFWSIGDETMDKSGEVSSVLRSKISLIHENESLKNELLTHDALRARLAILAEDNARMKALLNRASTTNMVVGAVLRRPPSSPYDTLVLDAGSRDGIHDMARVFAPGKVLIGTVTSLGSGTSIVTLFSSPEQKTDVVVGEGLIPAVAFGRGGGNFQIKLPSEVGISEGDYIRAPGLSSELLGVVEKISKDSTGSTQTIYFKNSFNMNNLDIVEIEK